MSIELETLTGDVRVKSYQTGSLPEANVISIGDYDISMDQFCEITEYVLANTDLIEGDPRFELVDKVRSALFIDGYNHGNRRIKL